MGENKNTIIALLLCLSSCGDMDTVICTGNDQTCTSGDDNTINSGDTTSNRTVDNSGEPETNEYEDTLYPISGTVSGGCVADGSSLIIQNNGSGNQNVWCDGVFHFPENNWMSGGYSIGTAYNITVKVQPINRSCSVIDGHGVIDGDVTNVTIVCY